MNKSELIEIVALKTEMDVFEVKTIADALFDTIIDEVKTGNRVQLNGFGVFELRERKEKKGRNPQTGESLILPKRLVPFFKPGKEFRRIS